MTDTIAARREAFLRQNIVHTVGMTRDPRNILGVHADASVNAWWGLRLLNYIAATAPDKLPALLADISDELEMGYAEEIAFEQATAAGLDPDAIARHAEQTFAATKES